MNERTKNRAKWGGKKFDKAIKTYISTKTIMFGPAKRKKQDFAGLPCISLCCHGAIILFFGETMHFFLNLDFAFCLFYQKGLFPVVFAPPMYRTEKRHGFFKLEKWFHFFFFAKNSIRLPLPFPVSHPPVIYVEGFAMTNSPSPYFGQIT